MKPVRAATLAARLTAPELAPPLVPQSGAEADAEMPGGRRLAVLVAEDNQINALLAQAMLGAPRPCAHRRLRRRIGADRGGDRARHGRAL